MNRLLSLLICLSLTAMCSQAAVINLTDATHNGEAPLGTTALVNNAFLTRSDVNSGSGSFRDLFRVQATGTEQGYNRITAGSDSDIPGGFDPMITVDDLGADSTGLFYVFSVDVNEKNNAAEALISLDSFAVYTGTDTDPATLPIGKAGLDAEPTFTNVWDLDENGTDNVVLLDNNIGGAGSGSTDLLIYIPQTRFAGAAGTDQVYIFAEFGNFAGFESDAGHENISALTDDVAGTFTPPIPEPTSIVTAMVGFFGLLSVRRRGVAESC